MSLPRTPSQTVGPFLSIGLTWERGPYVVEEGTEDAILIRGCVTDGEGEPLYDALVETWQADPSGHYVSKEEEPTPGFRGFGRCPTDPDGSFWILTLKPGPVPGPDGTTQAPHIAVTVFARGLLNHLFTRIYFEDDAELDVADPVLSRIEDPDARDTLIARRTEDGYRFDIRLQGERETVFFDV